MDVTCAEHWAAEAFTVCQPRTYFNPTDNQAMGWSIPAAIGAQRVHPGRQTVTVTGDGCFLMSAMEISTAAREGLPVKFFVLDDQAYHYMQVLQKPAYLPDDGDDPGPPGLRGPGQGVRRRLQGDRLRQRTWRAASAVRWSQPGPVLTRVVTDYGKRPIRWMASAKQRFTKELSTGQKARFVARMGARAVQFTKLND